MVIVHILCAALGGSIATLVRIRVSRWIQKRDARKDLDKRAALIEVIFKKTIFKE